MPGSFGDPTLVSAGLPTPRLVARLHVTRLRDGSVRVTGRVSLPSQADVLVNVIAHTRVSTRRLLPARHRRDQLSGCTSLTAARPA